MTFVAPAFLSPIFSVAAFIARNLSLSNDSCIDTLFTQRNIVDGACLKVLISKSLGWVMTGASAIVKTPVIRNMLKAESAAGLSPQSIYLETIMYSCSVAYFVMKDLGDGKLDEFNEYGENVNLTLQNVIIVLLMWR